MAAVPRRSVAYYFDPDVGNFYYSQGHPMKPHRMRMTHNLLVAYGLVDKLDVFVPPRATDLDMTRFHADEYISFLKLVAPESVADHTQTLARFNVLDDCPVFDGLWEYCQIAAGGSLAGAARLNSGESSIAVNWAGGLHHAKKAEASGFCYINDCVLAILELLKVHARVLYTDIDIHHGDGVEEAFYSTDRVMTVSFHKFGGFFPGTGAVDDVGHGRGKNYAVNFPLRDGIDDDSYREIFDRVMTKIMEWYRPGAVVLQCGADSLTGDRLGCFNLSLRGHAHCVDFFKRYDVPVLLLGGGGYTIRNVARCWTYETGRVLGDDLGDELPYNENLEFYAPEFRLHIVPSNMENHNTPAELEANTARIMEHLRGLPAAPSIPQYEVPRASPVTLRRRDVDSDEEDPDSRRTSHQAKSVVEFEDSDEEMGDDELLGNLPSARRRLRRAHGVSVSVAKKARVASKPSAARDVLSPVRRSPVRSFTPHAIAGMPARASTSSLQNGSLGASGTLDRRKKSVLVASSLPLKASENRPNHAADSAKTDALSGTDARARDSGPTKDVTSERNVQASPPQDAGVSDGKRRASRSEGDDTRGSTNATGGTEPERIATQIDSDGLPSNLPRLPPSSSGVTLSDKGRRKTAVIKDSKKSIPGSESGPDLECPAPANTTGDFKTKGGEAGDATASDTGEEAEPDSVANRGSRTTREADAAGPNGKSVAHERDASVVEHTGLRSTNRPDTVDEGTKHGMDEAPRTEKSASAKPHDRTDVSEDDIITSKPTSSKPQLEGNAPSGPPDGHPEHATSLHDSATSPHPSKDRPNDNDGRSSVANSNVKDKLKSEPVEHGDAEGSKSRRESKTETDELDRQTPSKPAAVDEQGDQHMRDSSPALLRPSDSSEAANPAQAAGTPENQSEADAPPHVLHRAATAVADSDATLVAQGSGEPDVAPMDVDTHGEQEVERDSEMNESTGAGTRHSSSPSRSGEPDDSNKGDASRDSANPQAGKSANVPSEGEHSFRGKASDATTEADHTAKGPESASRVTPDGHEESSEGKDSRKSDRKDSPEESDGAKAEKPSGAASDQAAQRHRSSTENRRGDGRPNGDKAPEDDDMRDRERAASTEGGAATVMNSERDTHAPSFSSHAAPDRAMQTGAESSSARDDGARTSRDPKASDHERRASTEGDADSAPRSDDARANEQSDTAGERDRTAPDNDAGKTRSLDESAPSADVDGGGSDDAAKADKSTEKIEGSKDRSAAERGRDKAKPTGDTKQSRDGRREDTDIGSASPRAEDSSHRSHQQPKQDRDDTSGRETSGDAKSGTGGSSSSPRRDSGAAKDQRPHVYDGDDSTSLRAARNQDTPEHVDKQKNTEQQGRERDGQRLARAGDAVGGTEGGHSDRDGRSRDDPGDRSGRETVPRRLDGGDKSDRSPREARQSESLGRGRGDDEHARSGAQDEQHEERGGLTHGHRKRERALASRASDQDRPEDQRADADADASGGRAARTNDERRERERQEGNPSTSGTPRVGTGKGESIAAAEGSSTRAESTRVPEASNGKAGDHGAEAADTGTGDRMVGKLTIRLPATGSASVSRHGGLAGPDDASRDGERPPKDA